jgi:hypothetical protein
MDWVGINEYMGWGAKVAQGAGEATFDLDDLVLPWPKFKGEDDIVSGQVEGYLPTGYDLCQCDRGWIYKAQGGGFNGNGGMAGTIAFVVDGERQPGTLPIRRRNAETFYPHIFIV